MSAQLLFDMIGAVGKQKPGDMPAIHRHLMIVLANFADDNGVAWPGKGRLARETGIAERAVYDALAELETAGWLIRVRDGGGATSTTYRLQLDGGPIVRARQGRHAATAGPCAPCTPAPDAPVEPLRPVQGRGAPRAGEGCAPCRATPAPRADDPPNGPTQLTTHDPPKASAPAAQPPLPTFSLVVADPKRERKRRARGGVLTDAMRDVADSVFAVYVDGWKRAVGVGHAPVLTDSRRKLVAARVKEFDVEYVTSAARGIWFSQWNIDEKRTEFDLVMRDAAHIERFAAYDPQREIKPRTIGEAEYERDDCLDAPPMHPSIKAVKVPDGLSFAELLGRVGTGGMPAKATEAS